MAESQIWIELEGVYVQQLMNAMKEGKFEWEMYLEANNSQNPVYLSSSVVHGSVSPNSIAPQKIDFHSSQQTDMMLVFSVRS